MPEHDEHRLLTLAERAPVGLFELADDGTFMYGNETFRQLVGADDGFDNDAWLEAIHPDDRERLYAEWEAAAREQRPFEVEYRLRRGDDEIIWVASRAVRVPCPSGEGATLVGSLTDISARKQAEEEAHDAGQKFRRAFENSASGMALIEGRGKDVGRFREVNRAMVQMSGYAPEQLLEMTYWDLCHPDEIDAMRRGVAELVTGRTDTFEAELRMLGAGDIQRWINFNVSLLRDADGEVISAVIQAQDVTERKRFESELQYLADHDPLTGLYNRRRFAAELERELAAATRYETGGALLILDLDRFKVVNDSRGHSAGDDLLVAVARAIEGRMRTTDIVGRLGGDEFGIILPHATRDDAVTTAESLRQVIGAAVDAHGSSSAVTTSVGVAPFGWADDDRGVERLVTDADAAMYAAKEAGRDRVFVHGDDGKARAGLRIA